MVAEFEKQLSQTLEEIKAQGLFKTERVITTPQDAHIGITGGKRVLNMCANNYLGLADHPALIAAAKETLDTHGFGMASVRFICGTQDIHKELEAALTKFLGTEETILYPSCFDANGGLFETLFAEKDAVISDELNHASIIDGVRLCKAQRFRYKHNDMDDLEAQLRAAQDARFRLIATDGCFSMDGTIANLAAIRQDRARHARISRRDGQDRYYHRHAWESARWCQRRVHQRAQGDRRSSAATFTALSVFQHNRATGCRRIFESAGASECLDRTARQARGKHKVLSRRADGARPDDQTRRSPDRPNHDRRRSEVAKVRRANA